MKTTATKTIVTDRVIIRLREDGIVHVHFKADTTITVELQDELVIHYNNITKIKRPFMFTGGEFVNVTKEARKNAITMEKNVPLTASAIVVINLAQRIIANYYYKFTRPKTPYKVFANEEQALLWLNENFQIN